MPSDSASLQNDCASYQLLCLTAEEREVFAEETQRSVFSATSAWNSASSAVKLLTTLANAPRREQVLANLSFADA